MTRVSCRLFFKGMISVRHRTVSNIYFNANCRDAILMQAMCCRVGEQRSFIVIVSTTHLKVAFGPTRFHSEMRTGTRIRHRKWEGRGSCKSALLRLGVTCGKCRRIFSGFAEKKCGTIVVNPIGYIRNAHSKRGRSFHMRLTHMDFCSKGSAPARTIFPQSRRSKLPYACASWPKKAVLEWSRV